MVAQAVEALSGKGPVSELWGFGMDRLVGLDRVRGPIPFSLRKFLAGKQVVPHQASFFGSSLVAKIGGYDLDFGIAADQEFILRAALVCEPVTIRCVLCEFALSRNWKNSCLSTGVWRSGIEYAPFCSWRNDWDRCDMLSAWES